MTFLKNTLKICIITPEYPPNCGGIGYYVYNIARILVQRGHKVTVITRGNMWGNSSVENIDGIILHRVKFIPLYPFHVKIHGIFIKKLLEDLSFDFDIIHLNTPLVPYINRLNPYITTQHSVLSREIATRKGFDLYSLGYKIFQNTIGKIDSTIATNASTVIAVSKQKAEELQQYYGISSDKIVVIKNGVDTEFFRPGDSANKKAPNLLYCGRIDAVKGINYFVTAAHYVNKEKGDIQFFVAGKGVGTLEHSIKRKVKSYNMIDNFHFMGSVNQLALREYYQQANIYIHPSLYEGISLSLLEAMSSALPCIATDIPGNGAVIDNEINGILVEPGNPEMLAEKTLMLLNDTKKCQELGAKARKKVVKYYDWNRTVDELEDVYQNNLRGQIIWQMSHLESRMPCQRKMVLR